MESEGVVVLIKIRSRVSLLQFFLGGHIPKDLGKKTYSLGL